MEECRRSAGWTVKDLSHANAGSQDQYLTLDTVETGYRQAEGRAVLIPCTYTARRSIHFNLRHWLRGGAVDGVGREEDAVR